MTDQCRDVVAMLCLSRKHCFNVALAVILVEVVVILVSEMKLHVWSGSNTPVEQLNGYADGESAESFLRLYQSYCSEQVYPKKSNVPVKFMPDYNNSLCSCIPDTLEGWIDERSRHWFNDTQVEVGGTWSPRHCVARQRVAVIIPFRDRDEHLAVLLPMLHAMLQRQQLHYTVYVVEQKSPDMFNKAMLMNAGFKEAAADADYDCYVFQDVDMIPEDDRNIYICSLVPRHVGSHLAQWNYRVRYYGIFGGVTAFTRDQFIKVNGFSNQYYGWGGEDDDMYSRIVAQGYSIVRFPSAIARYHMISHEADRHNPYNVRSSLAWRVRPKHYAVDGLSSVRYDRDVVEKRSLYTWIHVTLPEPPQNFKGYRRSDSAGVALRWSMTQLVMTLLLVVVVKHTA